jgi:hypothetical protein
MSTIIQAESIFNGNNGTWADILDTGDYNPVYKTAEKTTFIDQYIDKGTNKPPSVKLLRVEVRVAAIVELKNGQNGRINFDCYFHEGDNTIARFIFGYNCTVQVVGHLGSTRYLLTSPPNNLKVLRGNIALQNLPDDISVKVIFTNKSYGEYTFTLAQRYSPLLLKIYVEIESRSENSFSSNSNNMLLLKQSNQIQVPEIFINSKTLIDGSDIGSTIFTIQDQYQYYKEEKIDNSCQNYYIDSNKIKTTIFEQCCPTIVSVLIDVPGIYPMCNTKKTMLDKLSNILLAQPVNTNSQQFILNIISYSMFRYILSRLLYGNFDINYLLGRYFIKFLKDLENSRFCRFLNDFIDPSSQYMNMINIFFIKNSITNILFFGF